MRYAPRPQVQSKINAFRPIVWARLAEYPTLTATRIRAQSCAPGHTGGYTQVMDYVRHVRPAPAIGPVVRLETAPGLQAQMDFAEFRLP
ncbi:transposase [Steroidobacter sp. S1-65]|uniref:Transposase n=1 Tax=Steroidobacter gossypii TaxID=2805490 RepID=A0ABS1X6Q8_9GAMM|nr:transposase [Steroidobacter gossypii]MBM0108904.1 transposase [Steroidobacter gossypii]